VLITDEAASATAKTGGNSGFNAGVCAACAAGAKAKKNVIRSRRLSITREHAELKVARW
jgi:hypothetical protein